MNISAISGAQGAHGSLGDNRADEANKLDEWQTALLSDLLQIEEAKNPQDLAAAMAKYEKDLQGAKSFVDSLKKEYTGNTKIQSILNQFDDKLNGIDKEVQQASGILKQMFQDQGREAGDKQAIQHYQDEINNLQKEHDAAQTDHDKQNKIFNDAMKDEDKQNAIINDPKSTPEQVAAAKKALVADQAKATAALNQAQKDTQTMDSTSYNITSDKGIISNLNVEVSQLDVKTNQEYETAQNSLNSVMSDLTDETLINEFKTA